MSFVDDITAYKSKIRQSLGSNQTLLDLLFNKKDVEVEDEEIDEKIFQFDYIPNTQTQAGSYIGVEIEPVFKGTNAMKYMRIYVYITVHKSLMKVPKNLEGYVRTDAITREVDGVILGSRGYGIGRVELIKMQPFRPSDEYYGRMLCYGVAEFSRMVAG